MGWSFRLVRVAGIDIKIHFTFFLVLLLALPWGSQYGVQGVLFGVTLILLLFVCVTLHELGHSLAARFFGIPVREIVLLPLGGAALLSRNPSKPLHELVIALAGPLVNVVIAIILALVTGASLLAGGIDGRALLEGGATGLSFTTLLLWLLQANILLALFNMLPAFPLDGGRVLRAVLALFMNYQRATRIATVTGQVLAVGLGVLALFTGQFMLLLVAIFIFFGAGQEQAESQAHTMLTTLRVGDAYNKHALRLEVGDRVSKAVDYILTSYQPDFAVMQGSTLLGIVTRDDVLRALASDHRDMYVTMVMRREVIRVDHNAMLDEVRQTMSEKNTRIVAVYEGDVFLGLVSIEDISEAYAVMAFVQRQEAARKAAQVGGTGDSVR
nr:site-2 protease family protein [Chloroflexaceae bacterium]